ncbi:MAG: methyltransferase domain-containing protein [Clostridia bacterium]|nr:methyltransferase domain-containing protein [Clostridia bacterium]
MKPIDRNGLAGYNAGIEKGRLHRGLGLIEFERTKEILLEELPKPPAVIYDIGGAYGEYAFWLASLGYEVSLFDLAEGHIRMARELAETAPMPLKSAEVADARSIDRPDASADAILLFGPLYHIVDREERALCLRECRRLLRPGGKLFTANITCYATALKYTHLYDQRPVLDDDAYYRMIEATVRTGLHTGNEIGLVYFHKPEELHREVAASGFEEVELRGVIGPCWIIRNLEEAWPDPVKREAIMRIVRLLEREESLIGLSTHLISISHKPYE